MVNERFLQTQDRQLFGFYGGCYMDSFWPQSGRDVQDNRMWRFSAFPLQAEQCLLFRISFFKKSTGTNSCLMLYSSLDEWMKQRIIHFLNFSTRRQTDTIWALKHNTQMMTQVIWFKVDILVALAYTIISVSTLLFSTCSHKPIILSRFDVNLLKNSNSNKRKQNEWVYKDVSWAPPSK